VSTFTVTGAYAGRLRSVTWRDGRLAGDPVLLIGCEAAVRARVGVRLPGVWGGRASLTEHAAALATLTEVFDLEGVRPVIEGDELPVEPAPVGGVN